LGLPADILETARASLAPEQQAIDTLLDDLREERDAAAEARRGEDLARRRAEEARARAEARLVAIEEEKADRLDEAATALEDELAVAREALARAERISGRHQGAALAGDLGAAREALGEATESARRVRRRARRRRRGAVPPEQVRPGYRAWLQGVPTPAEALTAPDRRGEFDVSLGALRARVRLDQITRLERPATSLPERGQLPAPPPVFSEQIEVRGQTLDEALPRVEQF